MDRRGWLWKKKTSEKFAAAPDSTDSSQAYLFKQCDEQETEETAKTLNEQLSTALSELAAKEDLVRQHAKVAEEAVTGWEKAEAETATLKQKLDSALQQKLATEDRVLHLDGALKECMRQLRYVREEQEQRIHDMVMKNTKEWEKACAELEAKLADVGSQLLEASAANNAMSKSLQERAQIIIEVNDAKSRSDAEVKVLQVRLDAMEKENTKLKYEIHVLSKELEIRNEEREYNKRAGEAASKQHLENVKRIAKLETECQRLRLLVRKRLPGPAAVAQMKLEVEALGKETGNRYRRKNPSHALLGNSTSEIIREFDIRQSEVVSDRLVAMDEETKLLKEVLAKRNSELKAARLMCSHTASKLLAVEEQMESLLCSHVLPKSTRIVLESHIESVRSLALGTSREPSLASTSEDGIAEDEMSCAESWASALITELAHFKKEKANVVANKELYSNLDLMNDFAEMEKIASISSENHANLPGESEKILEMIGGCGQDTMEKAKISEPNFAMDEDIESATQLCKELRTKFSNAEEQLNVLRHKQLESEATIGRLKHHLLTILKAETDDINLSKVLEKVKDSLEAMKDLEANTLISSAAQVSGTVCLDIGTPGVRNGRNWLSGSLCEDGNSRDRAIFSSAAKSTVCTVGPELAAAVHNVLCLIDGLAQSDYVVTFPHLAPENISRANSVVEGGDDHEHIDPGKEWKNPGFGGSIQSLITLCQSLQQGKVDIIDFMAEVACALDWLVGYVFSVPDKSTVRSCIRRQLDWGKGSPVACDSDMAGTANSLVLQPCKVLDLEGVNEVPVRNSVSDVSIGTSTRDEELQSILLEKESLAVKLEAEIRRVVSVEAEIAQLRKEKVEIECDNKSANEKLEHLITQLAASEYKVADLQSQLAVALEEKQSLDNIITGLRHANKSLELEMKNVKSELEQLKKKAIVMEEELTEEMKHRKDVETQLNDLQQLQLIKGSETTMRKNDSTTLGLSADEEARLQKEQEITLAAEKLAECQQTILVLGKQLKALGAPKDVMEGSLTLSVESTLMHKQGIYSDHGYYSSESSDTPCNTGMEGLCASPIGYGRKWHGARMHDNENHSCPRGSYGAGSVEMESGSTVHRVQNSTRYGGVPTYGRQAPQESNNPISPIHGVSHEEPNFIPCSPPEPALSSPVRSPARFLSLKSRGSGGHDSLKHANSGESVSSSEKHGTGFSRFFHRTKSGH